MRLVTMVALRNIEAGGSGSGRRPGYQPPSRLQKAATRQGLTVEEFLLEHPDFKMPQRERQRIESGLLKLAGKRIEELKNAISQSHSD